MTTLLVVEADERIAEFVQRGLEAESYLVDVAHRGRDALHVAGSPLFDLILLGLELPDIGGLEVCQRLRADGVKTPVLVLSAMDAVEDKVRGLRMGADDYLTKPFAFAELLARIEALLRRAHAFDPLANELTVGDLSLSRERREAHRGGEQLALTPREFALLEFLMLAPGKVFSRTTILEKVWGHHSDALTNVVEVCIRGLRRKVDANHATALIRTVRGQLAGAVEICPRVNKTADEVCILNVQFHTTGVF